MSRKSRRLSSHWATDANGLVPSQRFAGIDLRCPSGHHLATVGRNLFEPDEPWIKYKEGVEAANSDRGSQSDYYLHLGCPRCPGHDGLVSRPALLARLDELHAQCVAAGTPRTARLEV